MKLALAVTLLGAGLWVYALATAPHEASVNGSSGSDLASGLAARTGSPSTESSPADARFIDDAAPAAFRLGMSFLGGFLLGYVARKFLRWSVLIIAVIVVGIFLLRSADIIVLPWDQIEHEVREGATWLQLQASSVRDFLTGYLPSTAAAIVGGFIGFMRG